MDSAWERAEQRADDRRREGEARGGTKWERIERPMDATYGEAGFSRTPVPGGWIYRDCNYHGVGLCFVPDAAASP